MYNIINCELEMRISKNGGFGRFIPTLKTDATRRFDNPEKSPNGY